MTLWGPSLLKPPRPFEFTILKWITRQNVACFLGFLHLGFCHCCCCSSSFHFVARMEHKRPLGPFLRESFFHSETSGVNTLLLMFWSSMFPPGWPTKLYLWHYRDSLAYSSKLLYNSVPKTVGATMATLSPSFFYIIIINSYISHGCRQIPQKSNLKAYQVKRFGSQFERIQSLMVEKAWFIAAGACGWDCYTLVG